MTEELGAHIIRLLATYQERERKIALLHYELEHPAHISPNEMLNGMSFGHGDGPRSPGYISDKTMYIALNYQEQADKLNASTKDEIAQQLVELEHEQKRLKYYVALLEPREKAVIQLLYYDKRPWSEIAKKLEIAPRTARRVRDSAIVRLTKMYDFTEGNS